MINPDWVRDEVILAMALYIRAGRKQLSKKSPEVVALSHLLNRLPIHPPEVRDTNFRNCDGINQILANLETIDKRGRGLSHGSKLHVEVWRDFEKDLPRLHATAEAIESSVRGDSDGSEGEVSEEPCFREGRILSRMHFERERKPELVRKKKSDVMKRTGKLACEVCGFDFEQCYGEIGHGFAECHHLLPLAQLPVARKNRLSDLAIVCANCHRMLHAPEVVTIQELRQRIRVAKTKP